MEALLNEFKDMYNELERKPENEAQVVALKRLC